MFLFEFSFPKPTTFELNKSFLDKKLKKKQLQSSLLGPVQISNFSCAETNAQITKIYFHLFTCKAFETIEHRENELSLTTYVPRLNQSRTYIIWVDLNKY